MWKIRRHHQYRFDNRKGIVPCSMLKEITLIMIKEEQSSYNILINHYENIIEEYQTIFKGMHKEETKGKTKFSTWYSELKQHYLK